MTEKHTIAVPSLVSRYAKLQLERNIQMGKWVDSMKAFGVEMPKPTRKQRLMWWLSRKRVALARFIAGNDWPEDY